MGLTDLSGSAMFQKVPESFILSLNNPKYLPFTTRQVLIYSDTLLTFKLQENKYNVTFQLLDEKSLNPFWGVSVSLNDEVQGHK